MRGRVLAVYALAVIGTTPIGGPIVGWMSEQFGPRWAYAFGGMATIASVLVFGQALLRAGRPNAEAATALDDDLVLGVDGEVISAVVR